MTVAIVTDSAAALPPEVVARHRISVVPMWLGVAGELVPEGERPLEALLAEPHVTTSGPNPGEFRVAIEEALQSHDEVLVLTIAESMSSTHEAARVAARPLGARVRVLDTNGAAGSEALVVLAAAEAACTGAPIGAVEARARQALERVRLVATLSDLGHLVRSGRVPGIAGWAGRRLGINPLFEFRGGAVRKLRPALGRGAAMDRIVALVHRSRPGDVPLRVVALHALALDDATTLLERVRRELAPVEAFVGEFGPVMVVHTGAGLVGLAWWWDDTRSPGRTDP